MPSTSDTRITGYEPLLSPAALLDELPLTDEATATVEHRKEEAGSSLAKADAALKALEEMVWS